MKILKQIVDIRRWKTATKTAAILIMAAVALFAFLWAINVTREEMVANASEQIKQAIEQE